MQTNGNVHIAVRELRDLVHCVCSHSVRSIGRSGLCVWPVNVWFHWVDLFKSKKGKKGSPCSIAERRVPELIPVLGSQLLSLQVPWVIKQAVGCHYLPPGLQLPSQPLRGLLPASLLSEQRHDGCEQFAQDCYPTGSQLLFEPRPGYCACVRHANHSATEPPLRNGEGI